MASDHPHVGARGLPGHAQIQKRADFIQRELWQRRSVLLSELTARYRTL
jgi:hypothetical protein